LGLGAWGLGLGAWGAYDDAWRPFMRIKNILVSIVSF